MAKVATSRYVEGFYWN